jgi:rhodanese-related sulfurtransferase
MDAVDFFAAKLAFETDISDVAAALASGTPGFTLVDSRSTASWDAGRVPGALHLPTAELDDRISGLDRSVPVVTYCWGPACNGATRSAVALARHGFAVREMIGGFEYWVREGGTVETADGLACGVADRLTTVSAIDCGC